MIQQTNSTKKNFEDYDVAVGCGENSTLPMSEVIADLKARRDNVLNGGINCIPWPFERFRNEIPGIEQEQYVVVTAGTKCGKCFGKGTRIRMADNSIKNIEDIRVGDYVMSPNNEKPKLVESLGSGREQMYRITSEMHNDLIVNESHIMYLYSVRKKKYFTMTLGELLKIQSSRSKYQFRHDYRMVMSDECELFQTPTLPLEPYFYGLWLGDGDTDSQAITTPNTQIVDYLTDYAKRLGYRLTKYDYGKRCPRYSINNLNHKIKGFKALVREVTGFQKEHINHDYLNASIEDRYELLAGIIDTDGYLSKSQKCYRITLQYRTCIEDIRQLANSLGIATTIRNRYNHKYVNFSTNCTINV